MPKTSRPRRASALTVIVDLLLAACIAALVVMAWRSGRAVATEMGLAAAVAVFAGYRLSEWNRQPAPAPRSAPSRDIAVRPPVWEEPEYRQDGEPDDMFLDLDYPEITEIPQRREAQAHRIYEVGEDMPVRQDAPAGRHRMPE